MIEFKSVANWKCRYGVSSFTSTRVFVRYDNYDYEVLSFWNAITNSY